MRDMHKASKIRKLVTNMKVSRVHKTHDGLETSMGKFKKNHIVQFDITQKKYFEKIDYK